MPENLFRIAVLVRSHAPSSRWATRGFAPVEVLTEPPAGAAPGVRIGPEGPDELWYAGSRDLVLHRGETGHYRDNLASGRPALWVALRRGKPDVAALTADPYEGEALAGDDGLTVEALAMPDTVVAALGRFVAQYHIERVFEKRRRRPADPEALTRRRPEEGR